MYMVSDTSTLHHHTLHHHTLHHHTLTDKHSTSLALLSPPLALKCAHSADSLSAITSLPNRQSIPLHRPLTSSSSARVQRAEFDALSDVQPPNIGEKLAGRKNSADMGTTALTSLGGRKFSGEMSYLLNRQKIKRPDNLTELFQNSETQSDDGYVEISDTEIDSYGYSRCKELPLPYSELTSEERDILDGYSRPDCLFPSQQLPISTRPPAPLPDNVVETRGLRRSIRRGRAHSVGDLSRSSELCEWGREGEEGGEGGRGGGRKGEEEGGGRERRGEEGEERGGGGREEEEGEEGGGREKEG